MRHVSTTLVFVWFALFACGSRSLAAVVPLFGPAVEYPSTGAIAVGVGDFNGDGVPDLVLADSANPSVLILLGESDGSFGGATSYTISGTPSWVGVGDFNRDGRLDIAVAVSGPSGVGILLGNGDGTFQPEVAYQAGSAPFWGVVTDLNGDGIADLAITSIVGSLGGGSNDGYVSALLGNGDGTFQLPVNYAAGKGPLYMALGDFNNDGRPDLVVTSNRANSLTMLLNNGEGTFGSPITLLAGGGHTEVEAVAVADANGDGNDDVFLSQPLKLNIVELIGNGDGTFQRKNIATEETPEYLAFGDFNADGIRDLVVPELTSVTVFLGSAAGKFQSPLAFPASALLGPVAIADFNADGKPDMAVIHWKSGIDIFLNQAAPAVSLSTTSLVFGTQLDGTISTAQSVKLTNNGYATLNFSSITVSGEFKERDGCGASLAQGASCNLSVAFAPTGPGTKLGTVTVTDDAGDSPQTISLNGQGTAFSLAPASLNFGNQKVGTTSQPQTVTLSAVGNGSMAIQGISIFGDFAQNNNCGTTLAGGSSCTITVTFTPSVTGSRSGSLEVDGGGGSPRLTTLSGNGT